ncbi:hypothetical protein [Mucilaginibacter gossypiicola]|uniref:hypothetical protein n=1 Tax=Mucilaginibacter gossypiicola TaxID=551995 RepID=UPI00116006ED|nr:hypothetical protein [Mucilaginibacter gossypiicola]
MKFEGLSLLMLNADYTGANAVTESRAMSYMISNAIAHLIYSRGNVDHWLTQHLISPSNVPGKSSAKILDRTTGQRCRCQQQAQPFATSR